DAVRPARGRGGRRRLTSPRGGPKPAAPRLCSAAPRHGLRLHMSARDITSHFAPLAADYDVVLSDVWGVVHNGAAATTEACDALQRFRAGGGRVVLITNAPRPGEVVVRRTLGPLGVPATAYDGIVSSGD